MIKNKKRSDYYIKSLKRSIQILNSFTLQKKELGITELSKKLNLHKSTIHRILVTLEDENIVMKNKISQKYRLGMKLFEYGNITIDQFEIKKYALPIVEDLAKKTEESIDLNIIIDDKRVSVEKIESLHEIRAIIQLGRSLPLYCGGSGKAILAFLPASKIERIISKENLISLGPKTITDQSILREHLKEIRKNGYAQSFEERVSGSSSIAAPIFDYKGNVIASISISGPITRFTKKKIPIFISLGGFNNLTQRFGILYRGYRRRALGYDYQDRVLSKAHARRA
jgi:IclR family transcriptional regulator, KDG regulon repressor